MKIVKITHPSRWQSNMHLYSPNRSLIWKDYKFEVNNDCNKCDFWIVSGDIDKFEPVFCPENNVIYLTSEAYDLINYNPKFLKQFYSVIAMARTDIEHPRVIYNRYSCAWFPKKDYDFFSNLNINNLNKKKKISIVVSDLTLTPLHKKRFALVNRLKGHFKDKIDIYGRGFNYIDDKYDALIDYQYSLAIENSVIKDYFTEKIMDCFLTYTVPIYYGCPNITDYFNQNSMIKIEDIDNYNAIEQLLEQIIESNSYEEKITLLNTERDKVLNKYQPLPFLVEILDNYQFGSNKNIHKKILLKTESEIMKPTIVDYLIKAKNILLHSKIY